MQQVAEEAETLLATSVTMGSETSEPRTEFERRSPASSIRLPLLSKPRNRSKVSAVAAVQTLGAALRAHRKNITLANDDAFRPAFIEEMAYCWVRLTGKSPAQGDEKFAAFVISAHSMLGSSSVNLDLPFYVEPWDPLEERARRPGGKARSGRDKWGFQIKKTLKRMNLRPEYDRVDRYEREFLPPTVDSQPSLARRKFGSTNAEFGEETKRLIKEMCAGGGCSRAAAQILWCEFLLAGRGLQKRYLDEFDFNPADAIALIWPKGRLPYG